MLFEAYLTDQLKFFSVANTGANLDVLLQLYMIMVSQEWKAVKLDAPAELLECMTHYVVTREPCEHLVLILVI